MSRRCCCTGRVGAGRGGHVLSSSPPPPASPQTHARRRVCHGGRKEKHTDTVVLSTTAAGGGAAAPSRLLDPAGRFGEVVWKVLVLTKGHQALHRLDPLARLLVVQDVCGRRSASSRARRVPIQRRQTGDTPTSLPVRSSSQDRAYGPLGAKRSFRGPSARGCRPSSRQWATARCRSRAGSTCRWP